MNDKPFDSPVRVLLSPGDARSVGSTLEAAELLANIAWPGERDAKHREAVEACLKVLDGHRSTIDARNAFVEAARVAGILVE